MICTIKYPEDAGTKFEMFRYPAGEVQVRLFPEQLQLIGTASNVIVFATIKDGEIMAVAQLIDAISEITLPMLVLPYFPYARADRSFRPGDCFGLEVFCDFLLALPLKKIVTLDIHSQVAFGFMPTKLKNISPKPIINVAQENIGRPVVVLPDKGASRYAFGGAYLQCDKKRDPQTGKLLEFVVPKREEFHFEGADSLLLVDDICDGGGTFIGLAEEFRKQGYTEKLYLYVTHGIFSNHAMDRLSSHFEKVYTTDSFNPKPHEKLIVIPCHGTILDALVPRDELWKHATACNV